MMPTRAQKKRPAVRTLSGSTFGDSSARAISNYFLVTLNQAFLKCFIAELMSRES
jgi:hypothetical protein